MIGNDIVDLKETNRNSNALRVKFLNKVFTKYEQLLIFDARDSFKMVWLLWSMKESAYKIVNRKVNERFFAPLKFQCRFTSKNKGFVAFNKEKYYTSSIIDANYINTIAFLSSNRKILNTSFYIEKISYKEQNEKVYTKLKTEIAKNWDLPIHELYIQKNPLGIPYLFHNNKPLNIPFSLSHHGNYGAFSVLK